MHIEQTEDCDSVSTYQVSLIVLTDHPLSSVGLTSVTV